MTALLADLISKHHNPGPGHPEQAARFDAALRGLSEWPLATFSPREASPEELELCHDPSYLRIVERDVRRGASELSTGDTQIGPGSLEVALRGVGEVLTAIDLVAAGEANNAFCAVRPPGHHANAIRGMGFCLFNNVAIAARYAQKKHGISRVLIVDWDVHHGNGTQDIFYEDGSVFFFSTHQSPWYPGTGARNETGNGPGEGKTLNVPLQAGAGPGEIVGAFREQLVPAADRFQPELVLISAGFDSRSGDPLGQFLLRDEDFAKLTGIVMGIAERYANARLVSVLEGGYNLSGLETAVRAHANALHA